MDTKICTICNIEKDINNLYKNIQNVETVTVQED